NVFPLESCFIANSLLQVPPIHAIESVNTNQNVTSVLTPPPPTCLDHAPVCSNSESDIRHVDRTTSVSAVKRHGGMRDLCHPS
ncbi:hypothetical protein KUCAC02_001150, partial [Chaenocephalus aceratus]